MQARGSVPGWAWALAGVLFPRVLAGAFGALVEGGVGDSMDGLRSKPRPVDTGAASLIREGGLGQFRCSWAGWPTRAGGLAHPWAARGPAPAGHRVCPW